MYINNRDRLIKSSLMFTGEAFRNILITVAKTKAEAANMETNSSVACAYHHGRPSHQYHRFSCGSVMFGRYVRVFRLNYYAMFYVYEIEVVGARN